MITFSAIFSSFLRGFFFSKIKFSKLFNIFPAVFFLKIQCCDPFLARNTYIAVFWIAIANFFIETFSTVSCSNSILSIWFMNEYFFVLMVPII
jgi:hypothetical protein